MSKHGKSPSPNDQRANVLNPNTPAHRAAQNNHANQLNPNNPAYEPPANAKPVPSPNGGGTGGGVGEKASG